MKQLIVILLLLIVGGNMFSSCCTGDCCTDEAYASVSSPAAADHPQDAGADGSCSPFFPCTTCLGFTAQVSPVVLPEPSSGQLEHHSPEGVPLLPTRSFSFWQPPKGEVHC